MPSVSVVGVVQAPSVVAVPVAAGTSSAFAKANAVTVLPADSFARRAALPLAGMHCALTSTA